MRTYLLSLWLVLFFANNLSYGQDVFINTSSDIYKSKGFFYDGTSRTDFAGTQRQSVHFRNINNEYYYFNFLAFDLSEGSLLNVFEINGKGAQVLKGTYRGKNKPNLIIGKDLIFEYLYYGTNDSINSNGWIASFETHSERPQKGLTSSSPASDCTGAIPLCSNNNAIVSEAEYTDTGAIDDEQGSCISGTGDGGSVWYTFTPTTNGDIGFDLIPNNSDDYDWVLYDATNGCASLTEMSCNYSIESDPTGMTSNSSDYEDSYDLTWSHEDCNDGWDYAYYSGDMNCGPWNTMEAVDPTHTYVLMINFYSGSNGGYNLNFTGVAITDNTSPVISSIEQSSCSGDIITVHFSEAIDCSTINNSDFTIAGYSIAVSNNNCVNGLTYSIELQTTTAMSVGNHTLNINNLFDICGNEMNDSEVINIIKPGVSANATGDDFCSYLTTTINSNGAGIGALSYNWSNGESTENITATVGGTYTVTVSDACGASAFSSVNVTAFYCGPIAICYDGVNLIGSGGDGNFVWEQNTGWFGSWQTVGTSSTLASANLSDANEKIRLTTGEGQQLTYNSLADIPACGTNFTICSESNGDLTVTGGTEPYNWDYQTSLTTCTAPASFLDYDCGNIFTGLYKNETITTWNNFATGSTITPFGTYPLQITDNTGTSDNILTTPGACPSSLPVTYLNISIKNNNNNYAKLEWTTASEINNNIFLIERSTDAIHFNTIGNIEGSNNSNSKKAYSFIDKNVVEGTYYYRIKQVDYDQAYSYSNTKTIHIKENNYIFKIYPNPSKGEVNIIYSSPNSDAYYIEVYTILNKKIFISKTINTRNYKITLDDINSGVYTIVIKDAYSNVALIKEKLIIVK